MKIIYSIIENPSKGHCKLDFKLVLLKEDWLLLNQFEHRTLAIGIDFEDCEILGHSGCIDMTGTNNHNIASFSYKPETFIRNVDQEPSVWESKENYSLSFAEPLYLKQTVNKIKGRLQSEFKQMRVSAQNNTESCWEEVLEIEY